MSQQHKTGSRGLNSHTYHVPVGDRDGERASLAPLVLVVMTKSVRAQSGTRAGVAGSASLEADDHRALGRNQEHCDT